MKIKTKTNGVDCMKKWIIWINSLHSGGAAILILFFMFMVTFSFYQISNDATLRDTMNLILGALLGILKSEFDTTKENKISTEKLIKESEELEPKEKIE